MPMFSDLARDARLDALTFLRTLVNDPNALADNYDDNDDDNTDSTGDDTNTDTDDPTPTLDLETLHHRRLAATAILRFHVDEADDFEYDDGGDDDNDTTDPDDNDDGDGEHDTDTDADPHTDPHADPEDVFDDLSKEPADAAADDDDTVTSPDNEAAGLNTESKLPAPLSSRPLPAPPGPAPPGPGGANERSHGWSERVLERAQPVERVVINASRPGGADDAPTADVHTALPAPPHTPPASHIP